MKQTETFITTLPESVNGLRLDLALSQVFPEISRSKLQKLIKNDNVLVNGIVLKAKDVVSGNEEIKLTIDIEIEEEKPEAEAIPLDILYEDEEIMVINKSAGMVVHPGAGNENGTLANALLHHYPPLAELERSGIVHRLDKNTSGVLVIAKTPDAETHLQTQFADRSAVRIYHALVLGELISGRTIDAPIGRNPHDRKKMMVTETDENGDNSGREAVTHIRVLERFRSHTLVECHLETGRTHQIRVHMQYINFPIIGDSAYGGRLRVPKKFLPHSENILRGFKRQALHAHTIGIIHPKTEEEMVFNSPLPKDMILLIDAIREDTKEYVG